MKFATALASLLMELANVSIQKAIRGAIELFKKVPAKPMLITQAIYGLISLASMHEMADELDLVDHCFQQASDF